MTCCSCGCFWASKIGKERSTRSLADKMVAPFVFEGSLLVMSMECIRSEVQW